MHIERKVSAITGKVTFKGYVRVGVKQLTKTCKKKSEVVAWARTIEGNSDIADSLVEPVLNLTFTEALEQFIPTDKKEPIHGNDRNFRSRLKTFEPAHLKLNQIKKSHVKHWLDSLDLAPATINRHRSCFGSFAKWVNS